jgi:hypothetical protein
MGLADVNIAMVMNSLEAGAGYGPQHHRRTDCPANEWDRSMVQNDVDAIGRYMAEDWTIIGSDCSVGHKATFLGLVKSGC